MLSKINFSPTHMEELQRRYLKVSLGVFEMTMYAFGLLERLAQSKLDFVFKGGTSLMLLLPEPRRVSTDIDILVKPGTRLDDRIKDIQHQFPLLRVSRESDDSKNGVRIAHYAFSCPPLYGRRATVLLDVYFGSNPYRLTHRFLANSLLINEGLPLEIQLPTVDSLLGDKLTSFAPRTIGVHPFATSFGAPCDKRLQIIKQLYDINALAEAMVSFAEVGKAYHSVAASERKLRGLEGTERDFIRDSFSSALSILTLGASDRGHEYRDWFHPGIEKLRDHVFAFDWNGAKAQEYAARALLLYACLASGEDNQKIRIINRAGFHDFPYSVLSHTLARKDLFDEAVTAVCLFDPKAK